MFPNAPYVTKIICQNIHRSYHNNAGEKKIENASLFLRLGLPSTLPHEKRIFSNWKNLIVTKKLFENDDGVLNENIWYVFWVKLLFSNFGLK